MKVVVRVALAVFGLIFIAGAIDANNDPDPSETNYSSLFDDDSGLGSGLSSGASNAVAKAEQYLDSQAFSRSGLIEQLKFEGFSSRQATLAVDQVDVDWMEQAALKAAQYLDTQPFSRSGLIEQLEYEGFTPQQASYGVRQAY